MKSLLTVAMVIMLATEPMYPNVNNNSEPIATQENITYTQDDVYNLVMITLAEAESESELGQRLVIDTVLNRVEDPDFPDTITDVIFDKGQFDGTGARWKKVTYDAAVEQLVLEELENRTNYEVLYFRTKQYPAYETPLLQEGNHYFSGKPIEEKEKLTKPASKPVFLLA